jgi:rfaE bifunctional protein nucleotidyltransferase chain/domain
VGVRGQNVRRKFSDLYMWKSMARIINLRDLKKVLPREGRGKVVLTGGCFDILHVGHVRFLSEAKRMGDTLVVLLESDEKVKTLKGKNRPIFTQKERAEMLSALRSVDWVVLLPMMEKGDDYLNLVMKIKPDLIAVTENDLQIENKKSQAKKTGAKLRIVPLIKRYSTSRLARILGVE